MYITDGVRLNYTQFWGYKVEDKLPLVVREQNS
jgi:hypothetical protein